uniref:protein-serine/threonine phosphatase n=1 Tax=Palpitomonas bilix TaxID=652834 RepID=A0A7S3G6I3_9EUKA|mmetsp:Transcript_29900/g.77184  ORF Transcript_29900/g.77184 Transcript_29900/m.77184 type:complete len:282 (+) Transcript_29900:807-1652(+)
MHEHVITQVERGDPRHYNFPDYDEEEEKKQQQQQPKGEEVAPEPAQKKKRKYPRFIRKLINLFTCFSPKQADGDDEEIEGVTPEDAPRDKPLLGALQKNRTDRKTLVLDLDETLVHSSFKPVSNADFIVPVEIDGTVHSVYVLKRPHVDAFMEEMGKHYEVVVFTASLAKYANPVLDLLDIHRVVDARLFREACVSVQGSLVKDLSRLGRPLKDTIILDNSPLSYMLQPENAVPISSWFDQPDDRELLDLIPVLTTMATVPDVTEVLGSNTKKSGRFGNYY